ncbi:MAG TPA: MFS transporter [Ktedonobacteraceae bacterium]|nr:MFS transporter [Ktedonobacteraceae bacterium]
MTRKIILPALRQRDFRLLWLGQLFSMIGSQMQLIGVNWHVYELLRGQSFMLSFWNWHLTLNMQAVGLGTLGAVRILPIFLFAFLGGAVADHWKRRQIVLWSELAACLCAGILGLLTLGGSITLLLLYLFTALDAGISAFSEPAQTALFPQLIPREDLANATTLFALVWQVGTIVGPMLAGMILASFSVGFIYLANAASFLIAVTSVALIQYREEGRSARQQPFEWRNMLDGFHFVRQTQVIWGTMLIDFYATFFSSARTMLPLVADQLLHVGARGYGLLATAQPIGAVLTGVILATRKPLQRQGTILLLSVALYGLATAIFGLSTVFFLSYILFALTGVGDTISTVIRGTIRQHLTPEQLRGRMTAVQMILAMGGPQLGEVESGLLAAALGTSLTIFTGGMLTFLMIGWLAYRYPALRTYVHSSAQQPLPAKRE